MPVDLEVRLSEGDHVVQFYESAEEHLGVVVGHLAGALLAGDAAIVVARPSRCVALGTAVAAAGVDVTAARTQGRFLTIDAERTLAEFMDGASPDPARFESVVGGLVRSRLRAGRVHVYGEMVGLLWDAGNVTAAIEVEDLWEQLSARLPFSLFCGYDGSATFGSAELDGFAEVCHRHSAVIGGAPLAEGTEITRRFARSTLAPSAARRFLADTLRGWDVGSLVDDGNLVMSELASNAVLHAQSDFTVGLSRRHAGVRVVVGDTSSVVPRLRAAGVAGAIGGFGLRLVDGIASGWGHEVVDGGKVVWADLGTSRGVERGRRA